MFGTGDDAGQTTIRLRHAYGEFGQFLAGQTNSALHGRSTSSRTRSTTGARPAWCSTATCRSAGRRFPATATLCHRHRGPGQRHRHRAYSRLILELERRSPVQTDEEVPDLTAHYRVKTGFGHVQVAGILRKVGVRGRATRPPTTWPTATTTWAGASTSPAPSTSARSNVIRAGLVYGEGIASYMNDGGMDARARPSAQPGRHRARRVQGRGRAAHRRARLYLRPLLERHSASSSIGYCFTEVDNTDGQTADAFHKGEYASVQPAVLPRSRT